MKFGGFDWDNGNLPKCLSHSVSLVEIEALFEGDVYVVRDTVVNGERRTLAFAPAPAAGFLRFRVAPRQDSAGQRALYA